MLLYLRWIYHHVGGRSDRQGHPDLYGVMGKCPFREIILFVIDDHLEDIVYGRKIEDV